MSDVLKYLTVYLLSAFKIIFGPTLGIAYGFNVIETILVSLLGMMTSVYLITYFGKFIRRMVLKVTGVKPRKKFTPNRRRFVKIWVRWGVPGIAFFTPILLSPIGGSFLVNAFGGKKKEIFKWMWIFGGFWSVVLTLLTRYATELISHFL